MAGFTRWVVLGIGVLMTGYGLITGMTSGTRYEVRFIIQGGSCVDVGIYINQRTGELVNCDDSSEDDRSAPPFTNEERDQVSTLASSLARDGYFTAFDQARVTELAHSIGAANGDPWEPKGKPGSPDHILFLAGIPMMILGGIIAAFANPRNWPRGRQSAR